MRSVRGRYPNLEAFHQNIPDLLGKLGFDPQTAAFLAATIEVDPARGSGHAWGPFMRTEKAHLRTRVPEHGMNYKGFNVAMHELGHNVEQVFSLYRLDHTLLQGVPNTAFTEGFAFVFQARDLEVLGTFEARYQGRGGKDPGCVLGHPRDRRGRPGRYAGMALDVRAPRRHSGAIAQAGGDDSQRGLEQLLRSRDGGQG